MASFEEGIAFSDDESDRREGDDSAEDLDDEPVLPRGSTPKSGTFLAGAAGTEDEDLVADLPGDKHAASKPRSFTRSASYPAQTSHLGTSAPIGITGSRKASDASSMFMNPRAMFVPPHQLTMDEQQQGGFGSLSHASEAKRDRLRNRRAILEATGFMAGNINLPQPASGPLARAPSTPSGLSQALAH